MWFLPHDTASPVVLYHFNFFFLFLHRNGVYFGTAGHGMGQKILLLHPGQKSA
jgi:hypothetical protein